MSKALQVKTLSAKHFVDYSSLLNSTNSNEDIIKQNEEMMKKVQNTPTKAADVYKIIYIDTEGKTQEVFVSSNEEPTASKILEFFERKHIEFYMVDDIIKINNKSIKIDTFDIYDLYGKDEIVQDESLEPQAGEVETMFDDDEYGEQLPMDPRIKASQKRKALLNDLKSKIKAHPIIAGVVLASVIGAGANGISTIVDINKPKRKPIKPSIRITYTVDAEDLQEENYIYELAKAANIDPMTLARYNKVSTVDDLTNMERIRVPYKNPTIYSKEVEIDTVYTMIDLDKIAERYHTSIDSLLAIQKSDNNLVRQSDNTFICKSGEINYPYFPSIQARLFLQGDRESINTK